MFQVSGSSGEEVVHKHSELPRIRTIQDIIIQVDDILMYEICKIDVPKGLNYKEEMHRRKNAIKRLGKKYIS